MTLLYIVLGWIVFGFIFSIVIGRVFDAYDYRPQRGQVSPGVFKYGVIIIWPVIIVHIIFAAFFDLFKWLNRLYNRAAKVSD